MKKYFKSFEQSAKLSSRGAMESGDHFKNGASPKSLTSRGNLNHLVLYSMKRFTLILAVAMGLMFISCSKDPDEASDSDETVDLAGTTWIASSGATAISFPDKSNCRLVINGYGDFSGTYSYTPPNITILFEYDPLLDMSVVTGTISGNTMELSYRGKDDGKEHPMTFEKR
jgi:hypothetical protein